jgi:two-component system response regulator AtoC
VRPDEALRLLADAARLRRPDEARGVLLAGLLEATRARAAFVARAEQGGLRLVEARARTGAPPDLPPRLLDRVAVAVREMLDGVEAPPPGMTGGRAPRGAAAVKAEAGAPPVHALPVVDPETGALDGVLGLVPDPAAPTDAGEADDDVVAVLASLVTPAILRPPAATASAPAGELKHDYSEIITRSPKMQAVLRRLDRVIGTDVPVLVVGETGTGKELIARALHRNDERRRKKRFYAQNCGALTPTLLESELFGHEPGAFTGADKRKKGLFEIADGSTLFLDEIGEMGLDMQTRLLRVLQEHEIIRLGSTEPVAVDVRIVAATHRDLEKDIAEGRFRQDLYFRLRVVKIDLPPLRDRPEDIPVLIDHVLKRIARERGGKAKVIDRRDERILATLTRYAWPGNVRQLENVITKLAYLSGDVITWDVLAEDRQLMGEPEGAEADRQVRDLDKLIAEVERGEIELALKQTKQNRSRAAALLGINRRSLLRRLQKYGLASAEDLAGEAEGA